MESQEGENVPEKETKIWIKRLYTLRRNSQVAEQQAKAFKSENITCINFNPINLHDAKEIAKEVEQNYLSRKDFDKIRKTDPGYQQLVESFVSEVVNIDGYFGIDVVEKSSIVDALKDKSKQLKAKADEIAKKHDTPEEKAEYSIFAIRAFLFKKGPVWYKGPSDKEIEKLIPNGITQIKEDMVGMDEDIGTYESNLMGLNLGTDKMSRLEALTKRNLVNVKAVPPTKPFLSEQPKVLV